MDFVFQIEGVGGGGAEKQLFLIARILRHLGHRCRIFAFNGGVPTGNSVRLVGELGEAGIEVVAGPGRRGGFMAGLPRLVRAVANGEGSVLWCWGGRSELAGYLISMVKPRITLLSSVRGSDEGRYQRHARLLRFIAPRVDFYVGNSRRGLEVLSRAVPGVLPRCRVLLNALEGWEGEAAAVALPTAVSKLRVVMLGNVRVPTKGYDLIVVLAKEIKRLALPVEITVAGIDHAGGWLQREITVGGLTGVLRYVGPTDAPKEFLSSGNVFLLMSRHEGLPNALIEAMNLGLPCITSDVGDVRGFDPEGRVVRIVPIGGVQEVIDIFREFLGDWDKARCLGRSAFQYAKEQFSETALKDALLRLVGEIASVKRPGHRI